jgi:hypothetical protein
VRQVKRRLRNMAVNQCLSLTDARNRCPIGLGTYRSLLFILRWRQSIVSLFTILLGGLTIIPHEAEVGVDSWAHGASHQGNHGGTSP